jgi:protein HOOK3
MDLKLMYSLKIKIRNLERQLGEMQLSSDGQQSASALNKMLEESNRARDRYQADYLAIRSEVLKLQAQLEYIRSGKGGDG